jgi:hypothetical protein
LQANPNKRYAIQLSLIAGACTLVALLAVDSANSCSGFLCSWGPSLVALFFFAIAFLLLVAAGVFALLARQKAGR